MAREVQASFLPQETPHVPGWEFAARWSPAREVSGDYYDFVPVDSWALKMVSHEWHDGRPVGQAEVEEAFAPWGEWKGLAYWFWDWSYGGE